MKSNKTSLFFLLLFLILAVYACKKPPGPGGRATVKGKIFVKGFDNTQQYLLSQEYAPGETVYIIYGTNSVVGNSVKTTTDGSYQFLYLNKGHYTVFANSLDTSIKVKGNKKMLPVTQEFDITGNTQTINLPDIIINK
jgi:hypothetical protein